MLTEQQRNSFPLPPSSTDRQRWQEYEEVCLKARSTAGKRKDKITEELKRQNGVAARQRIQKQYPTKQEQLNKHFFGEATDNKQLTHILHKETREMLDDPDAVLDTSCHKPAKPASGSAKTKDSSQTIKIRTYP